MDSGVTLNLMTWNSGESLNRCLKSVEGIVDQILVNDRFSTDQTLEILQSFDAQVFQREFSGSFADERNFLIERTKTKWILILDSDEVLSEDLKRDFKAHIRLMEEKDFVLGSYSRKNFIDGKLFQEEIPGHGRLFLQDRVKYFGRVHEQPFFSGRRVYFRDYFILHYKTQEKQAAQNLRYKSLL